MFTHRQTRARELMEQDSRKRTADVNATSCSLIEAQQRMQAWKELGRFSVFTAGAFDIFELNHVRGLVQCRLVGAASLLGIEDATMTDNLAKVHRAAASNRIGLMLTMDTNRALEEGKSRRPDKGNAPKPTLDWVTRAAMAAAQSMPGVDGEGRVDLVDYITRHGPDCCNLCEPGSCINEDNARMVVALQPDLVVVGTGSKQTITDLNTYKESGRLPTTELVTIDENEGAFCDPILNGPISTTAIIARIRS